MNLFTEILGGQGNRVKYLQLRFEDDKYRVVICKVLDNSARKNEIVTMPLIRWVYLIDVAAPSINYQVAAIRRKRRSRRFSRTIHVGGSTTVAIPSAVPQVFLRQKCGEKVSTVSLTLEEWDKLNLCKHRINVIARSSLYLKPCLKPDTYCYGATILYADFIEEERLRLTGIGHPTREEESLCEECQSSVRL